MPTLLQTLRGLTPLSASLCASFSLLLPLLEVSARAQGFNFHPMVGQHVTYEVTIL